MENLNLKKVINKFKKLGIKKGSTVLLSSSFFKIGNISNHKNGEEFYKFYYEVFKSLLGPSGTLVVNAFTSQVPRRKLIYKYKKTNSNSSGFDNYIRKKKSSILSFHVSNSVAAIGKNALKICKEVSCNNYGYNSPYFNLLRFNPLIVRIGLDYAINAYTHVAETIIGVPYIYNKLIKFKYQKNKKIKIKSQTMSVRYLDLNIDYDYNKIHKDIKNKVGLKKISLGSAKCYSLNAKKYFDFILKELSKNPHYLLKKVPNYKFGKIPFDGPSGGRDGVV